MISEDTLVQWEHLATDNSRRMPEILGTRLVSVDRSVIPALIAEIRALRKNQITPTGKCHTTHNACDCVLRELEALRKIKDALRYNPCRHTVDADICDVCKAIDDYEREKGEG